MLKQFDPDSRIYKMSYHSSINVKSDFYVYGGVAPFRGLWESDSFFGGLCLFLKFDLDRINHIMSHQKDRYVYVDLN